MVGQGSKQLSTSATGNVAFWSDTTRKEKQRECGKGICHDSLPSQVFGNLDRNGNGQVSFEEFVRSQQVQRAVKVRELGRRGEKARRQQFGDEEIRNDVFDYKPGWKEAKLKLGVCGCVCVRLSVFVFAFVFVFVFAFICVLAFVVAFAFAFVFACLRTRALP